MGRVDIIGTFWMWDESSGFISVYKEWTKNGERSLNHGIDFMKV